MDCTVHGVTRDRYDWVTFTFTIEPNQDGTECIPSLEGTANVFQVWRGLQMYSKFGGDCSSVISPVEHLSTTVCSCTSECDLSLAVAI